MDILADHISKAYGEKQVLQNFSFSFTDGACFYLDGKSGAGKTTLLRLLTGLEQPDAGAVHVRPEVMPADMASRFGTVFQENILLESFTAVENIDMVCRDLLITGKAGNQDENRTVKRDKNSDRSQSGNEDRNQTVERSRNRNRDRQMDRMEFIREELLRVLPADCLDKPVRELSGGMRRRVCIVRAVLNRCEALVMDEPFAGLDPETAGRCMDYILERRAGRLLILTGHRRDFYRSGEFRTMEVQTNQDFV